MKERTVDEGYAVGQSVTRPKTTLSFSNRPLFTTALSFLSFREKRGICSSADLSWKDLRNAPQSLSGA